MLNMFRQGGHSVRWLIFTAIGTFGNVGSDFFNSLFLRLPAVVMGLRALAASPVFMWMTQRVQFMNNLVIAGTPARAAAVAKLTDDESNWVSCIVYPLELYAFYDFVMLFETLLLQDTKLHLFMEWSGLMWLGILCLISMRRCTGTFQSLLVFVCNFLCFIYINLQVQIALQSDAELVHAFMQFDLNQNQ
jgi:hypothetical protein